MRRQLDATFEDDRWELMNQSVRFLCPMPVKPYAVGPALSYPGCSATFTCFVLPRPIAQLTSIALCYWDRTGIGCGGQVTLVPLTCLVN